MFNKPSQNFFGVILALLVVVFIAVLFRYNGAKSVSIDKMTNYSGSPYPQSQGGVDSSMNPVSASMMQGDNYLQVGCNSSAPETNGVKMNPHDLLPKDRNSEWASVNPASQDLTGLSLLNANEAIGINTVGSSLRNANLQIRSEPIIPKTNIGPWNNSTIEADLYHRPLEIGQGVL